MPDDLSWLPDAIRNLLKKEERWDDGLGGDPLRPLEGDLRGFTTGDCFARYHERTRRTLRCRLLGCKPLSDAAVRWAPRGWCEIHQATFYTIDDGTMFGRDVHQGCCVRCGNAITPRARALKGST